MTPKEKANDLIKKCEDLYYFSEEDILLNSKHYAKIIVDEILLSWKEDGNKRLDAGIFHYWKQVKNEIEKL